MFRWVKVPFPDTVCICKDKNKICTGKKNAWLLFFLNTNWNVCVYIKNPLAELNQSIYLVTSPKNQKKILPYVNFRTKNLLLYK